MNEQKWDKLLKIRTTGRDDSRSDTYRYPYEPTPYEVLERIANSDYIGKKNTLVDYGSGKGRVDFFLSYQTGCTSIGIEYDDRMVNRAEENLKTAISRNKVGFELLNAEEYEIDSEVDRFYFFNPFSVELLKSVVGRIKETYYNKPRTMYLLFYFPSDEYVSYLMTVDEIEFVDEIYCGDLFEDNKEREKVLIFAIE